MLLFIAVIIFVHKQFGCGGGLAVITFTAD